MMDRRDWITLLIGTTLAGVALGILFAGCQPGGGHHHAGQALSISFVPDGAPATGEIALAPGSEGEPLVVRVVAGGGFAKAYALAFRLTYDRTVMEYAGPVTAGDPLKAGGVEVLSAAAENDHGQLVVGVSRANTFQGVTLAAGDEIASLVFRPVGKGSTRLDFSEERRRLADERLEEITVNAWTGGTVTVK